MPKKKVKYSKTEYYDLLFTNSDLLYIIFTYLIPPDIYNPNGFIIKTRKHCQLMEKLAFINNIFYNVIINCKYSFEHYFPSNIVLKNVLSILGSLNDIAEMNINLFPNITEIKLTTLEFNNKYRLEKCFVNVSLFRLLEKIIGTRNIKYIVFNTNKKTDNRLKKLHKYIRTCGYQHHFKIIGVQ
jgi:hypothetical protein